MESPVRGADAESAEKKADELLRNVAKVERELALELETRYIPHSVAIALQSEISEFVSEQAPLMMLMSTPGLMERHWQAIQKVTNTAMPWNPAMTMRDLLDAGINTYCADIEEICVGASKEYSLEQAMNKMELDWSTVLFETKGYRTTGTYILCSTDEIQQLVDDQIVKTLSMRSSRYIGRLLERATQWEKTLTVLQETLDNWLKVQATWLYLEPIFGSDDIMRQMPVEGRLFKTVDVTWRENMSATVAEPLALSIASRHGFLTALIDANAKLDTILKGLNEYLETKRLSFPRFFFLSNDELLEILAETKVCNYSILIFVSIVFDVIRLLRTSLVCITRNSVLLF
jgi:dynein heavy chain, axonemal